MDGWMFWILVFPVLLAAILYLLGFLTIGSGVIAWGLKSGHPKRKILFILIGLGIIASPFIGMNIQHYFAEQKADRIQQELADMERIDLSGRLPARFVAVGGFTASDKEFIRKTYGIRQFPDAENDRLKAAYRNYRKAEFCHKYLYREKIAPNVNISNCRDLPTSIQAALGIDEPVLFFVDGSSTSYRRSNVMVGKMYEIRLVTPQEDLLVDYFEERAIDRPPSILNPYASGRKLASEGRPPTRKEFIQNALQRASR